MPNRLRSAAELLRRHFTGDRHAVAALVHPDWNDVASQSRYSGGSPAGTANPVSTVTQARPYAPWGMGRRSWWARSGPATECCPYKGRSRLFAGRSVGHLAAGSGRMCEPRSAAAVSQNSGKVPTSERRAGAADVVARIGAAYSVADFSDKLTHRLKKSEIGPLRRCSRSFLERRCARE